jgi:hypothetical protein
VGTSTGTRRGGRGGALGIQLETKGFKDLGRALAKGDRAVRLAFFKQMNAAMSPIVARARGMAPRRSGELAGSVRVRRQNAGARGALRYGVGSTLAKAPVLEFANRGRYSSLVDKWGPSPRYLIPAVDAEADGLVANVDRAVNGAVEALLDHEFRGSP